MYRQRFLATDRHRLTLLFPHDGTFGAKKGIKMLAKIKRGCYYKMVVRKTFDLPTIWSGRYISFLQKLLC